MKRTSLVAAVLLAIPTISMARDSFDGCGLGWEVTDKKTVIATTTRATTNNVVPPTFGMTSGTIGCSQFDGIAKADQEAAVFVAMNFEQLKNELAVGQGEYVDAAAQSFNCSSDTFASHIQGVYSSVVAPTESGLELYNSIKNEVASNSVCI